VVKKVHVRVNEAGTLYFDFHFRGVRCKEYTRLTDTPDHRKRCEKMAQIIANEIDLGRFDYLRHFPYGSRRYLFTGRPDGNISFEHFAQESWLPHIRTKVRESTAEEYEGILHVRVFPLIGSILLREFRPEYIDRLINHLRSLRGMQNRPLSPRRINIILLRVRSVLDLAYKRGYLEKNPHVWVTLQREKSPHVDPFSLEERQALLEALPEPEKGFRSACANFWKNYFIVAFDTGLRPSEQLALRWAPYPQEPERTSWIDFEHRKIFIRQGLVRGAETDLKTKGSYRVIDMLPTVEEALRDQLAGTQGHGTYVFSNSWGGPLDLTNIRHRIWYPTLARSALRPQDLYQTRHTFAPLMLQAGEDPA
jgi:integrase